MFWQTSRRKLDYNSPLIMGILNVTPDSFSDGGKFDKVDSALHQVEKMIAEGVDIIDVGGESTRPNSERISADEEKKRVTPIIESISKTFDVPISIDTCKSDVANAAIEAGAEIINDISGLRFDENIALISAKHKTGLILMHSRGDFETRHKLPAVENILDDVEQGLNWSIAKATDSGVRKEAISLDIGIGFSKSLQQNLELIARLSEICVLFKEFPILVGTSRKSFIGRILDEPDAEKRLSGSLASVAIAVWNGAKIVRVHDVKETVEAIKIAEAIKNWREIDA